jgi:hypothetical protein
MGEGEKLVFFHPYRIKPGDTPHFGPGDKTITLSLEAEVMGTSQLQDGIGEKIEWRVSPKIVAGNAEHCGRFVWDVLDVDSTKVDECLVGQWVATRTGTFSPSSTGGGTGFRVSIERSGKQTVDYSGMEPFVAGDDRIFFAGKAVGRITTKDKVAKAESVDEPNATLQMLIKGTPAPVIWPLRDWFGPGGLGSTTDNNAYTCERDTVTYTGSTHADRHANFPVTLTRVKQ